MKVTQGFTLFFSEQDAFSNWYMRDFTVKGITFNCMEQYMMYSKAMLFKDTDTAAKILNATGPRCQARQKALGKEVKNFVEDVWKVKREPIVTAGLVAKFSQHRDLKELLISTDGTILVEASKYDGIWGAKLDQNDPRILDPTKWPGLNLLGKCLETGRAYIIKKDKELANSSTYAPS